MYLLQITTGDAQNTFYKEKEETLYRDCKLLQSRNAVTCYFTEKTSYSAVPHTPTVLARGDKEEEMSRCLPHPSQQQAATTIDDFLTSESCMKSLLDGLHSVAIRQTCHKTKMAHDENVTTVANVRLYTASRAVHEQTCTNAPAAAATGHAPFALCDIPLEIPERVDLSSLQSRSSSLDALDIFVGPEGVTESLSDVKLLPDFMLSDDTNFPCSADGPVRFCPRMDSNLSSCSTIAATGTTATACTADVYGDQWLAFSDDGADNTDPDTVADLANVKDQKVQPSVGVLEDYCRVHMRMGVSEIKPIVLLRILDLSRLFRCVSAQGFVEMLVGKGVNSLFGFERLVVHKPVEFTLAITSMLNGWNRQRLRPPRFSLFTELLRLLGIHPKRSSRFLWREELQSVLDATRNQHGHFLMSGECHSEYVFSLARMRKNCLRLRRRIRDPEI